jgi:hypothetical protein
LSEKFIQIGEHFFELPALPKSKDDILFVQNKKEDAFWNREQLIKEYKPVWFDVIPDFTILDQKATLYNEDGMLTSLNSEDSAYVRRIYEQEMRRRIYGAWFKNGDDFEYITGNHYFLLMWAKMQCQDGSDYAKFMKFQRDYFYLIDHCWKHKNILGLFTSKAKKTGITNLHWSGYYLNKALTRKNKNLGAMNLDEKICSKMFRDYFIYSYNGLPSPLKVPYKSKAEMQGSIIFGRPLSTSKKFRKPTDEEELNTSVFVVATQPKAFDVAVMSDAWIDEPPKIKNIGEIFRTNKESVKIQDVFNGRFWMTSYTPDEDSDAFKDARDIFYNSELRTIRKKDNGQTDSGLICYHIPAYASLLDCIDRHGDCAEKEAVGRIFALRDNEKGNQRNLQAIIRQYANDKKEAWNSAGAGSIFDNIRLGNLRSDLQEEMRVSPDSLWTEGNLMWTKELWNIGLKNKRRKGEFCDVKFVPLTEEQLDRGQKGSIRMYQDMPRDLRNLALRNGRDEYNCLLPPLIFTYFLGADPTNYAAASEVIEGSKNAYYVMNSTDERLDAVMGKVSSKIIMFEYFDRPEQPDDAYEDLVKLIIYTGALSAVEANAPYMATKLMEEGLGNYMLVRDENGIITIWKRYMGLAQDTDKSYKLLRTTANAGSKEILETFVRLVKIHLEPSRAKDYGKTIKSDPLLDQCMNLDATDTKKSDLFMAWGYCLFAQDCYTNIILNISEDYNEENYASVLAALAV